VDVHIAQSGDHEPARQVKNLRPGRDRDVAAMPDRNDLLSLDEHRHVVARRRPGGIDHRDMGQGDGVFGRACGGRTEQ